jgi:hypothetical protein
MWNHTDKNSVPFKLWNEKKNKWVRNHTSIKYKSNQPYKISRQMRVSFSAWMRRKGGLKAGKTEAVVGCTWAELVKHLNDNALGFTVGQEGVDIDHIRPVSSFRRVNDPVEQRECMNFNNLQLMSSHENRNVKRARYDAAEYARSPAGIAIAKLREGWEVQFASMRQ